MTCEELIKDLMNLDAVLAMSPVMQTALRIQVRGQSVPFSFGAIQQLWLAEILKKISAGMQSTVNTEDSVPFASRQPLVKPE
jgi:hypothetical protein